MKSDAMKEVFIATAICHALIRSGVLAGITFGKKADAEKKETLH